MTTTYDPLNPAYLVESDLREEMTRVFDLCHGCRLCFKFCDSFPTLFAFIDEHDDQDAAKLTVEQQNQVVDECFNCKRCYINCPYTPNQHEWKIDFPRLMLRAEQVLHRDRKSSLRGRLADKVLANTDLGGRVNTVIAPVINKALGRPGTKIRLLVEKTVGVSAQRVLPPYSRQRFSTWFKKHTRSLGRDRQATAVLFPTCIVEYQDVGVGHDMVKVYEHNGIQCDLPEGEVCCGAPYLHHGDVESFREHARKNVDVISEALHAADRARVDGDPAAVVVVPQPTCSYVLKYDYVDYIGGDKAEFVASRTRDAAEYLIEVRNTDGLELDEEFPGEVPIAITYHAPCHLRAQNIGLKSRDLMKLTGAKIKVVAECSGIDGTWGLKERNFDMARGVAARMAKAIDKADIEVVAGDCSLANGAIVLENAKVPVHPLQIVARAYGIPEEASVPRLSIPDPVAQGHSPTENS